VITPAIVLFDGVCTLCNSLVRFVAANDPAGRFQFLPLQSPRAQALLAATGGPATGETIVLLDYGRRYERSDAALHLALGLRPPWPLLFSLILVPRALRDSLYRWIARNRYHWFGRYETCPLPSPALRDRFLDAPVT
jgi:predicted DCC family thiol-disulfide oxidoreductase YuxK